MAPPAEPDTAASSTRVVTHQSATMTKDQIASIAQEKLDTFDDYRMGQGMSVRRQITQYLLCAAVVLSGMSVAYLAPRYFVTHGTPNYIIAAIPFFFVLMAVEFVLLKVANYRSKASTYDVVDSWSSLAAGSSQQLIAGLILQRLLPVLFPVYLYTKIHENFRIIDLPEDSTLTWILALVCYDFIYYWGHRFGHTVAVFWAGHRMHHSGEHYNLSAALRQGYMQPIYQLPGPLPFAFFIPPRPFFINAMWNTVYQFWVHTCLVRRLGPIEWILSTPSHHRIHHDRRFHKNFGGIFIIWDRLFGTFMDETECLPPTDKNSLVEENPDEEMEVFGIRKEPSGWSDAPVQGDGWNDIVVGLRVAVSKGSIVDRIKGIIGVLVKGPGWNTALANRQLRYPSKKSVRIRLHHDLTLPEKGYLATHFMLGLAPSVYAMALPQADLSAFLFPWCMASLILQGYLVDRSWFAQMGEAVRCFVTIVALLYLLPRYHTLPTSLTVLLCCIYAVSAVLNLIAEPAKPKSQ